MASDSDWQHVCAVRTQMRETEERLVEELVERGWQVRAPPLTSSFLQMVGCSRSALSDGLLC